MKFKYTIREWNSKKSGKKEHDVYMSWIDISNDVLVKIKEEIYSHDLDEFDNKSVFDMSKTLSAIADANRRLHEVAGHIWIDCGNGNGLYSKTNIPDEFKKEWLRQKWWDMGVEKGNARPTLMIDDGWESNA